MTKVRSFTNRAVRGFPKWKITAKYTIDEDLDPRLKITQESHLRCVREAIDMVLYGVIHHEFMKRTRDGHFKGQEAIYPDFTNSSAAKEYDESTKQYLNNSIRWNTRMLEGKSRYSGIYSKVTIQSITITTSYGEVWEFDMELLKEKEE